MKAEYLCIAVAIGSPLKA